VGTISGASLDAGVDDIRIGTGTGTGIVVARAETGIAIGAGTGIAIGAGTGIVIGAGAGTGTDVALTGGRARGGNAIALTGGVAGSEAVSDSDFVALGGADGFGFSFRNFK